MEKFNLPNKSVLNSQTILSDTFVARLYSQRGFTIEEAIETETCDIINYDYSNIHTVDKESIKEQVMLNNQVIMYLNIRLTDIPSDKIIKAPSSYKHSSYTPFVCIGWSDFDYLTSYDEQGKKIKNRGYLMVCPINEPIDKEHACFLPYKYVKYEEEKAFPFIKEVWFFSNVDEVVIPPRNKIEMRIGDFLFKDNGKFFETDATALYHTKGNPIVPLRRIAERLDYTVKWSNWKKTIVLTKDCTEIIIKIGEDKCHINGIETPLFLPIIIDKDSGRSYATLGVIKTIFKCDAEFIKEKELIKIYRDE